jgi:hypothetical protein
MGLPFPLPCPKLRRAGRYGSPLPAIRLESGRDTPRMLGSARLLCREDHLGAPLHGRG